MTLIDAFKKYDYLVVAHRGSSGTAPENTIASFRQAIISGAHCIEMDVQVTSDGIPVVFHDKWLSRTTNGAGLVQSITFKELQKFDSGEWFSKNFIGEKIPSLEEVLSLAKSNIYINIELKNLGLNFKRHIEKIIDLVEQYNYNDKIIISSFYYNQLAFLKKIAPKIPTAAIRIPKDTTLPSKIAETIECQGFVCSIFELDEIVSQDVQNNGLFLGVYPVDSLNELNLVLNHNAKAIVTNHPRNILDLLRTNYKAKV
jgi:glycerophosphoryl diester phosphodiesterase